MVISRYYCVFLLSVFLSELSGQTHCLKGDSLYFQQDYLTAAYRYNDCWQTDTQDFSIRLQMARSLYHAGDWAEAAVHFHTLEYLDEPDIVTNLAQLYETQQNLPKAIKYYHRLESLYPGNPLYVRKLAVLYNQGNESVQAEQLYLKALSMNARDILSLQGLADMWFAKERTEEADSLVNVGLRVDSMNISLLYLAARIQYRKKDFQSVTRNLLPVANRTELPVLYNNMLGFSLMQVDSLDKAIFYLNRTLQKDQENEYALFYMGLAYEKKNQFAEALYFFQAASKAGISANMHLFHQGEARVNIQMGKYNAGLLAYEKSLSYKKEADLYFYMANAAETGLKNNSKAIRYYEKFLKAGSADPEKISIAKIRLSILKEQNFMKAGKQNR